MRKCYLHNVGLSIDMSPRHYANSTYASCLISNFSDYFIGKSGLHILHNDTCVISGYFGHNVEKVAKENIGYFGQFLLETAASIVHIL